MAVADSPLATSGLLAPTYRNQLAFIDLFSRGNGVTPTSIWRCVAPPARGNRAYPAPDTQRYRPGGFCRGVRHGRRATKSLREENMGGSTRRRDAEV